MPKDTKSLGNNKAPACESRGFVRKRKKGCILTHLRSWGVSESVIGLTLVAGGTSLPELATSVTAALKKNPGIAIGNVIGSNLFNIFFVLGCSATVSPLPMGNINNLDLSVLIASSLLLWLVGWFFRKRTITRLEGALMVGCYVVYTAYLIAQQ